MLAAMQRGMQKPLHALSFAVCFCALCLDVVLVQVKERLAF